MSRDSRPPGELVDIGFADILFTVYLAAWDELCPS